MENIPSRLLGTGYLLAMRRDETAYLRPLKGAGCDGMKPLTSGR